LAKAYLGKIKIMDMQKKTQFPEKNTIFFSFEIGFKKSDLQLDSHEGLQYTSFLWYDLSAITYNDLILCARPEVHFQL